MSKDFKERRERRKEYHIKWNVRFEMDRSYYIWSFMPTILFVPWRHRIVGEVIFDVNWLIFHIGIGTWCRKERKRNEHWTKKHSV